MAEGEERAKRAWLGVVTAVAPGIAVLLVLVALAVFLPRSGDDDEPREPGAEEPLTPSPSVGISQITPTEHGQSIPTPDFTLPADLTLLTGRPLRVMTYNIHHAEGLDGRLDLERIATVLRDSKAQVIGLQEVDVRFGARSGNVDQARWLAERLGMTVCFSANLRKGSGQFGVATLSALPMSSCNATGLPRRSGEEPRGVLSADITVGSATVRFLNTHLTQKSSQGREAQARAVSALVEGSDHPVVVVGDFNTGPHGTAYAALVRHVVDVWPGVGVGTGLTVRPGRLRNRIDYVLASEAIRPVTAWAPDTRASDHLPVVADLFVVPPD